MIPDRTFAPEIMGMNLSPYLARLQRHDMRTTIGRRLLGIARDGNRLRARIGTDYSDLLTEGAYDQIVLNCGTLPNADLYFHLRPASRNLGAVDHDALIAGQPQTNATNPAGRFDLFRIGDAVSGRNTHAAIYDALRLLRVA